MRSRIVSIEGKKRKVMENAKKERTRNEYKQEALRIHLAKCLGAMKPSTTLSLSLSLPLYFYLSVSVFPSFLLAFCLYECLG